MIKELFTQNLTSSLVDGDQVQLKTSHHKHQTGISNDLVKTDLPTTFAGVLNKALMNVNDQQVNSEHLIQQLVADPSSVNLHNVIIASEKARMSLTFTKAVTDLAIKTYRELTNLR